ncbi:Uncharacterized protein SCF082_LOCUS9282, partial [Durusdinium trenchii]
LTMADEAQQRVTTVRVAPPAKLWVEAPENWLQCKGVFLLQKESANERPVWKKTDAAVWIYANKLGHWCVGGPEAKSHGFDWNRCFLYSAKDSDLPCDLHLWHGWADRQARWVLLAPPAGVSEVPFSEEHQRVAWARAELAQLRAWAEVKRRRRDWWRPPAPPDDEGASLTEDAMARRAEGLIELGVDLSTPLFNEGGETLLMLAAEQGWIKLCRHLCGILTRRSLDAQEEESGYTALFYATRANQLEIIKLLLDAKASPQLCSARAGATP